MNWPDISHLRCWLDRTTIIDPHRRRKEDPKRTTSIHAKESHPSSQDSSSSRRPTVRSDNPTTRQHHPDIHPIHRHPTAGSEVSTIRSVPVFQQPRTIIFHISKLSYILVLYVNISLTIDNLFLFSYETFVPSQYQF